MSSDGSTLSRSANARQFMIREFGKPCSYSWSTNNMIVNNEGTWTARRTNSPYPAAMAYTVYIKDVDSFNSKLTAAKLMGTHG